MQTSFFRYNLKNTSPVFGFINQVVGSEIGRDWKAISYCFEKILFEHNAQVLTH